VQSGPPLDAEAILLRFNRLIRSFNANNLRNTVYQPWEVQILLDIHACHREQPVPKRILEDYRKAARRQVEESGRSPMLLSEYLKRRSQVGRKSRVEAHA